MSEPRQYRIIPKGQDVSVMNVFADKVERSELGDYSTLFLGDQVVGCVWETWCNLIAYSDRADFVPTMEDFGVTA